MAVLGNRGTGLLDMLIEGFRNQGQEVITPFNMSPVDRERTPLQQAMNRPAVTLQNPGGQEMVTLDRGRTFDASPIPSVQRAIGQAAQPMSIDQARASEGFNRIAQYQAPSAQPQSNVPVNRLIEGQQFPQGSGVALTPQQVEMQGRQPFQMTPESLKASEDAAKIKDAIDKNPQLESDPSFMDQVKNYFGSRENMLRLAMAFNTMRLEPDQGLARALGDELGEIRKTKTSQMSQGQIVNYLQQNGYPELAQVAAQNPTMAAKIMEQVLQKELKPGASPKTFEPQVDVNTGEIFSFEYDPDKPGELKRISTGVFAETPAQKAQRESTEVITLQDRKDGLAAADSAFERVRNIGSDIDLLYQALTAAKDPNTQTGFMSRYLPAFTSSTAALKEAGNRLGLNVVGSVTFGALSAGELGLALDTALDTNLPREQLIVEIERRLKAREKLYKLLMDDAELLASGIGKQEYRKIVLGRRKEIQRVFDLYDKLPSDVKKAVDKTAWRDMNMIQQKEFLQASGVDV